MSLEKENKLGKTRQFCSFYIADRLFGIDILEIREIKDEFSLTAVRHAPAEIRGLANIRGIICLILDLRLILGFDARAVDEMSRLILFKEKTGESFGVLVDQIGDIAEVDEDQIEDCISDENSPPETGKKTDISAGICKLKDELLIILATEKVREVRSERSEK
ncbi:MAG: hypothetical protein GY795_25905 [Desulfobacterales bacterium]|nr:hypothetical protein [Desulfobacterales bacterium]